MPGLLPSFTGAANYIPQARWMGLFAKRSNTQKIFAGYIKRCQALLKRAHGSPFPSYANLVAMCWAQWLPVSMAKKFRIPAPMVTVVLGHHLVAEQSYPGRSSGPQNGKCLG